MTAVKVALVTVTVLPLEEIEMITATVRKVTVTLVKGKVVIVTVMTVIELTLVTLVTVGTVKVT